MNMLVDLLPPKTRRYVYGGASLVLLVLSAWRASDGHWMEALTELATGAVTALAHANTNASSDDGDAA